jgi:PAS domain S-box-containing protein
VLDPDGTIAACNPAVGQLLRREPADLIGGTFFEITHPADLDEAKRNCAMMQDGLDGIVRHECRFLRSDGDVVWVLVSTSRVPATVDRSAHLIMHIEDVTERKHLEAELHHRALHDPLTGLANRALLAQRIREAQAPRVSQFWLIMRRRRPRLRGRPGFLAGWPAQGMGCEIWWR